jgi:hypothetical protein
LVPGKGTPGPDSFFSLPDDKQPQLGPEAATVKVEPDAKTQRAVEKVLEQDPGQDRSLLRLLVGGMRPTPTAWAGGGRVFLNVPEAILAEPAKLTPASPYYVGSFSFFPVDGDDGREQGFYFALAPVLRRLAKREELSDTQTFRVTVVGLPRSGRKPGRQDDTIAIGEVRFLEVPDPSSP